MANAYEKFRKLSKMGQGSYYLVLPAGMIRNLGWRERQKLEVIQENGGIKIKDWEPKRK